MNKTKVDALAESVVLTQQLIDLRAYEEIILARRRKAWLIANARDGVTYEDIEEACGVSDGLLCKELRRARGEHPSLVKRKARQ